MVERKSLTVQYRRMEDPVGAFNGATLEVAIRSAMTVATNGTTISANWNERAWSYPPDNTDIYLMNLYHDDGISFFGDLTVYTRGFLQTLLKNEPNVAMLAVEQQPPPSNREYIHSMMYWLIVGNHVLLIQSRSLTSKHLEQYLTWLLKTKTQEVSDNGHVILNAKFDGDQVGGDMDDVKEIIVGGTGVLQAALPDRLPPSSSTERHVQRHVDLDEQKGWGERALHVLRAIMTNEADVQRLLDTIPQDADLDVSVRIGYKALRRTVSRAPMQQALRNLPEGEITAIGKYGRMTGEDIRLSYPVRVQTSGSLLNPKDVRAKLRSAYEYFVENGKIDP